MIVRWGTTISTQFTVANGAKQGGIISPILFNMYMDDLSIAMNNSGIGGYLGDAFLNHLCYADDICLISLSSSGMQQLLTICQNYATNHQLMYNGAKSFSLCFKNNAIKIKQPSFYLLRFCDSLVASLLFSKHIHFRVRALFTPYVHVFSFLHFIFSALISNCS